MGKASNDTSNDIIISLLMTVSVTLNPFTDYKILDWSKLKQIADDILKCI